MLSMTKARKGTATTSLVKSFNEYETKSCRGKGRMERKRDRKYVCVCVCVNLGQNERKISVLEKVDALTKANFSIRLNKTIINTYIINNFLREYLKISFFMDNRLAIEFQD